MNNSLLNKMLSDSFARNKVAVIESTRQWSYRDFATYTFYARDYFVNNGTSKIMICLPQSYLAYCLIWGAYLAGVTFCNVNIDTPTERMTYFIDVFNPDIVFCDVAVGSIGRQTVQLAANVFFKNVEYKERFPSSVCVETDKAAYVLFTSGSTGLPKGVQIKRSSLENFLLYAIKAWDLSHEDILGQYNSLGFDLSIADVFIGVLSGVTLVPFATKGEKLLPGKMIEKHRITFWHSVPSVVDLLSKANAINAKTLSTLRKISFCGERLYPQQLELLFNVNESLIVFNTYGPTEATVFCSIVRLTIDTYSGYSNNTICIGNPIDNMYLLLCDIDENGIGELVIAGENVSCGYLYDSQTMPNKDECFGVTLVNGISVRSYRSGDYAYYIGDRLYFYGRKDGQIKVMGNRVDLSEIDYNLRIICKVAAHSVFLKDTIISFVESCDNSIDFIIEQLRAKLPEYYIPQKIVFVNNMPLNGSGKISQTKLLEVLNESHI